ncbi:RNase H domain-containing protein [Trichonephila clavipes]|uniref:RNase H domain-containing protein n=1 Tax=Trichonephila clavipes TaxID=2585209 RepID=A0A8X6SVK6_TRICX|nr:RNase H domain-containing protein [Trichonephila clavipes]
MYTNGSKLGSDCSGSGIYINFWNQEIKIQRKIPDTCSVFRSELVVILEGLTSIESLPQLHNIWIFSIHFQWILSHINIAGNEIADSLARRGAGETAPLAASLTYLELFSKYKAKKKVIWRIPPVHP